MRVAWLIVLLCLAAIVQAQTAPKNDADKELEKLLGRSLQSKPSQEKSGLQECQELLQQWQDWYGSNIPVHKQLMADYATLSDSYYQLKDRNEHLEGAVRSIDRKVFCGFAGVGVGVFLAFMALRAIRRWWPVSKQRRQLITLLLVASWVTIAALIGLSDPRLSYHPVNLALSVFVYSLPALTFGSVAVWWFGRTKPEILW